jgi:hypothetical protein
VISPSLTLAWHLEQRIPLLRQKLQIFTIFGICFHRPGRV